MAKARPDEALHLAGALQLVGYRHVLATLWSISDDAAPAMADITYAHLLHPDPHHPGPANRPQAARASYALHHAVTGLRQEYPGEPLMWAPYITLAPEQPLNAETTSQAAPSAGVCLARNGCVSLLGSQARVSGGEWP
jgi:CHAT domain-containing protein